MQVAPAPQKTTATTAPAQGSGGLPQFDLKWWPGEIFWFTIIFAIVFALMAKVFTPKIAKTINDREDRISGDIGEARKLKEEAEAQSAAAAAEMAQARARAQKLAADARARANAEIAAIQAAEDAKLAGSLASAEVAIRTARDQAMANVRAIAKDTAQAIIEKLTGEAPEAAELEAALEGRALDHV
jgi:F-type H+-transporting ATPase subunit b